MPFNAEQLAYAGNAAINYFLKNDPIDQVNVDRPLIELLMDGKSQYAGGLQYVVEQLRYSNDSNFQSYFGDGQVTYNRKRTLQQAKFPWGSFHDGFGLNEDEMTQNGIMMTDDKNANASDAERVQLTNLLKENTETLKLGFEENFDIMLHRNGTQSATDIPGLDNLISTTPTVPMVVGGLDQSVYTWWQNWATIGIASGTAGALVTAMEQMWRNTTRYGGKPPNKILCGAAFIDAYRTNADLTVNRFITAGGLQKGGVTVDAGTGSNGSGVTTGLFFKGVELIWDPVFEIMDTLDAPAVPWTKRCYFIRKERIKLRPIAGHWMISRKPPRVYDRYVHYWALTSKAALTTDKRNSHGVLSIA